MYDYTEDMFECLMIVVGILFSQLIGMNVGLVYSMSNQHKSW